MFLQKMSDLFGRRTYATLGDWKSHLGGLRGAQARKGQDRP